MRNIEQIREEAQKRRDDMRRTIFLRSAAITFAAVFIQESDRQFSGFACTPEQAWQRAQELWDKKPEDC